MNETEIFISGQQSKSRDIHEKTSAFAERALCPMQQRHKHAQQKAPKFVLLPVCSTLLQGQEMMNAPQLIKHSALTLDWTSMK